MRFAGEGSTFEAYLEGVRPLVDRALDRALPRATKEPRSLHRAMRYCLFPGGKRLRPALCLLACEAFGGRMRDALPAACALEMLHTYSLVHDDLPCMDDDDLRRGRPTCHRAFGEATAVLAGDALLTLAFETLAKTRRRAAVPDLVATLARAAGTEGMVGGQVADLESEGRTPRLSRVEWIHRRKTASLVAASLECGAIAAGAAPERRATLRRFGETVGFAFQIADDVLDVLSSADALGKTPGKDARAEKMTYPACVGAASSIERARAVAAKAERLVPRLRARRPERFASLARFVVERGA